MRSRLYLGALLLSASLSATALAQSTPKFQFEKPPEKPTEWLVQAKGGMLLTSGNSQSINGNMALVGSRQSGDNKLSFEGGVAYGRSNVIVPVVEAGVVTALDRVQETTTNMWRTRGRYDRFLTPNNTVYGLAQLGADRVAGKNLVGGGQVGYSRQVVKTEQQTIVAELGYDFSYESYVASVDRPVDPTSIHSARIFVGELFAITPSTGVTASVEALLNLNKEKAPNASDPASNEVGAFKDTRITGKAGLTTTLYKNLSFGFGFTVLYDQNPAPRPVPASAKGAPYAAGFFPFANRVDTLTEATLVFTFL